MLPGCRWLSLALRTPLFIPCGSRRPPGLPNSVRAAPPVAWAMPSKKATPRRNRRPAPPQSPSSSNSRSSRAPLLRRRSPLSNEAGHSNPHGRRVSIDQGPGWSARLAPLGWDALAGPARQVRVGQGSVPADASRGVGPDPPDRAKSPASGASSTPLLRRRPTRSIHVGERPAIRKRGRAQDSDDASPGQRVAGCQEPLLTDTPVDGPRTRSGHREDVPVRPVRLTAATVATCGSSAAPSLGDVSPPPADPAPEAATTSSGTQLWLLEPWPG